MRRAALRLRTLGFVLAGLLVWASAVPAETRSHVVKRGETLWQIALETLGDPWRWPELYRANRDQIKDPATLYAGQRLTIPGDPTPVRRNTAARRATAPPQPAESKALPDVSSPSGVANTGSP